MFRTLVASLALATIPAASAQPAGEPATITAEHRAAVRQYVQRERRSRAALPEGYTLALGGTLPVDIELYTFPEPMNLRQYRYTMVGSQTVLVEPGTRRIVQIVE